MTLKQATFVACFKKYYPKYKADAPTLAEVCKELGYTQASASSYLYAREPVKQAILEYKQKLIENGGHADYIVTAEWVMGKLTSAYEKLERDEESSTKEIVDVLNSITSLLVKFRGKFDTDIKRVQMMSMPELLDMHAKTAGLIFGNERAGELMKSLYKSEGYKEGQYGKSVEMGTGKAQEILEEARRAVDDPGDSADSGDEETAENEDQGTVNQLCPEL